MTPDCESPFMMKKQRRASVSLGKCYPIGSWKLRMPCIEEMLLRVTWALMLVSTYFRVPSLGQAFSRRTQQ